jgi:hypothetical protein
MNHVLEGNVWMFAVDCVGTFDAAIQRRWIFVRMKNANVVVVANLAGLGVSSRRALISLAHKRNQVVVEFGKENFAVKQVSIEGWPVVE